MHQFLKFILERNSKHFGQFPCPWSGVFHCTHSSGICHTGLLTACKQDQNVSILILLTSCLQTCMTYAFAVCTVKNSWWWTEELSETWSGLQFTECPLKWHCQRRIGGLPLNGVWFWLHWINQFSQWFMATSCEYLTVSNDIFLQIWRSCDCALWQISYNKTN